MNPEIPDDHVVVGQIVTVWGLKGDVKVRVMTDFPNRLAVGKRLVVGGEERRIKRSRFTGKDAIVAFAGIDTREAAELLRNNYITLPISKLPKLEDDAFYHHELIGLRVETEDGRVLGTVSEVMETGANDVYVVKTPDGDLLLPAIYQVVKSIEPAEGRMVVELMPGLEPTPKAGTKKRPPEDDRDDDE